MYPNERNHSMSPAKSRRHQATNGIIEIVRARRRARQSSRLLKQKISRPMRAAAVIMLIMWRREGIADIKKRRVQPGAGSSLSKRRNGRIGGGTVARAARASAMARAAPYSSSVKRNVGLSSAAIGRLPARRKKSRLTLSAHRHAGAIAHATRNSDGCSSE